MKSVFEARGATIFYNVLISQHVERHFLIPANACPAIPFTLTKAGVPFSVLDIERETLAINRKQVLELLASNNKKEFGLIYVRTYGCEDDPSPIFEAARDLHPDVLIIDDKCLCIPEFSDKITPYADVVIYSTGPKKMVDMGYGGFGRINANVPYVRHALPLKEGAFEESEREFRKTYEFSIARSDWLDTTPPDTSFERYQEEVKTRLAQVMEHKRRLNSVYDTLICETYRLPTKFQKWRYNILVPNKEKILRSIFDAGLFASSHYLPLLKDGPSIVQSKVLYDQCINLFNDFYYTKMQAENTAILISKILK